jgi:hypothetical protein
MDGSARPVWSGVFHCASKDLRERSARRGPNAALAHDVRAPLGFGYRGQDYRICTGPRNQEDQKPRKRKSLALPSTFSRIAGSGSMRAISTAPIIVEKIAKKARSLSTVRRPGMNGIIWLL